MRKSVRKLATLLQGVLEIQLLVSHYSHEWVDKNDAKRMSFFRRQVEVTKNIVNPPWLDWPVAHPPTRDRRRE